MAWKRGKAYAQDLRDRVFMAADGSHPVGHIAATLSVSISYVSKVLSRRRLTGEIAARPQRCHVPRKLAEYDSAIREQLKGHPDATLAELRTWLRQTHKVCASITLIAETLVQLQLTLKKRPCTQPSRAVPTSPRHATHGVKPKPA